VEDYYRMIFVTSGELSHLQGFETNDRVWTDKNVEKMWEAGQNTRMIILMNFDSIFYVLFLISRFLVEKKKFSL